MGFMQKRTQWALKDKKVENRPKKKCTCKLKVIGWTGCDQDKQRQVKYVFIEIKLELIWIERYDSCWKWKPSLNKKSSSKQT